MKNKTPILITLSLMVALGFVGLLKAQEGGPPGDTGKPPAQNKAQEWKEAAPPVKLPDNPTNDESFIPAGTGKSQGKDKTYDKAKAAKKSNCPEYNKIEIWCEKQLKWIKRCKDYKDDDC